MRKLIYSAFFIFISLAGFSQVDLSYYLPQNQTYSQDVVKPKDFLGFEVGEFHATPFQIMAYHRELSRNSDRMKVETYGRTHENKELMLVTITSPENHARLEEIRQEHLKLMHGGAPRNLENMPLVVWMGFSVHGNEPSGTNASMLTAYHLAAAQGPEIDEILKNTIILLDPNINPDGGTRFAAWVNSNRSRTLVSDGNSREFRETWPNGRTNHYWFDLNRDWLYQQLPESRGRMVKFYEWMPNILNDHHEMGTNSTFFFQPGIPERTHPLTPQKNIELTGKIAAYHAKALDAIGSKYYTEENFDDFYYGKGSTLPDINGSIGILYEQASSRGHLQESIHGPLSFPFTIRNQFTTTLSTLEAGKDLRVELLEHMRDFYTEKSKDAVKAYVFGGASDKVSTWEMINMFKRNQIEVYKANGDVTVGGKKFEKDDAYIIPMDQPQHRLIQSMFEKRTSFTDSAFYDVSAWTTPLTMNVPYAESNNTLRLGAKIDENKFPEGSVIGEATVSYLYEWDSYYAARTTLDLLEKGYTLKYATLPFTVMAEVKEKDFSYGTIQVYLKEDQAAMLNDLNRLAKRDGVTFYGQTGGLTVRGIDLGSERFRLLKMPEVLLITGQGVNAHNAGEVWHLLDQRFDYALTFSDISSVNRMDLSKYTHVIMSGGSYSGLNAEKIKSFVQSGGALVTLADGTSWASRNGIANVSFKPNATPDIAGKKLPFDAQQKVSGALVTRGSIFEVKIDQAHPLCYGYKQDYLPIFKVNNNVFTDTGNAYNTPLIFTSKPLMAGYIHEKNLDRIKDSPAAIAHSYGSGQVISFTDNPNFRAFWYGTNKLFLNSLFFNQAIGGRRF